MAVQRWMIGYCATLIACVPPHPAAVTPALEAPTTARDPEPQPEAADATGRRCSALTPQALDGVTVATPAGRIAVGTREVSTDDYRRCVEACVCERPNTGKLCNFTRPDKRDHPVNCVSWPQARDYCAWIGARLPTQAEWAAAATGGGTRGFPWGTGSPAFAQGWTTIIDLDRLHWFGAGTAAVGFHEGDRTPEGALDMAGNVAEWVMGDSGEAASCGGSWDTRLPAELTSCRSAAATAALATLGIRCVGSAAEDVP